MAWIAPLCIRCFVQVSAALPAGCTPRRRAHGPPASPGNLSSGAAGRDKRRRARYNDIVLTYILLLTLAVAGDIGRAPVRCDAIWIGPSSGCDLAGSWASTGLGQDEDAARAAAQARLRKALDAGSDAIALRFQTTAASTSATAPQRASCATDVAARTRYACLAEPELKENRLCFADLPEPDCWDGEPLILEGPVWREMERGRDQVCRQMEDGLKSRNASAQQVATCRARCYQAARVRCPDGLLDAYDEYAGRPIFITEDAGSR